MEWARLTRKRQGLEKMLEKESKDFKNSSVKNVSMITKALRNVCEDVVVQTLLAWRLFSPDWPVDQPVLGFLMPLQNHKKLHCFPILSIHCSYLNWYTLISYLVCQTCIFLWSRIYPIWRCKLFHLVFLLKICYQHASVELWINEKTFKSIRNARFTGQSCTAKTRLNNLFYQFHNFRLYLYKLNF